MDNLRKQIDVIDEELMHLLEKRFALTKTIGKYKSEHHIKVDNPQREQEILKKADNYTYAKEIKTLYQHMFTLNKVYQQFTYGLVGKSLPYTLSPRIYEMLGLENYQVLETDDFHKTLNKLNFKGINITIPYKKEAFYYCSNVDDSAFKTGVVNTIVGDIGYNTDYLGFLKLMEKYHLDFKKQKVVIIGNGATSQTINMAIGGEARFLVRTLRRKNEYLINDYDMVSDANYLINTTPYGTYPNVQDKPLFPLASFKQLKMVIDVIYNPINSPLLIEAKKYHLPTMNGLPLLVEQANLAYNLYTKTQVDKTQDAIKNLNKELYNVVLIGLSYSGKTTLGKVLSKELNKELIDTDELLQKQGHDLNTIIKEESIAVYRQYETQLISEIGNKKNQVIATGGGVVLSEIAMQALQRNSVIVFIDTPLDILLSRLDDTRPLLKNKDDFIKMYQERYPLYQQYSQITINNDMNIKTIVEKIYEYISH